MNQNYVAVMDYFKFRPTILISISLEFCGFLEMKHGRPTDMRANRLLIIGKLINFVNRTF
jgi:hypothetical protein